MIALADKLLLALSLFPNKYEEGERYNAFLRSFKAQLLDESATRSRADFWDSRMRGRLELGLITDKQSMEGPVGVSDQDADEFINL